MYDIYAGSCFYLVRTVYLLDVSRVSGADAGVCLQTEAEH